MLASLFSCLTSLRLSDILTLCWEEIVDFAAGGKCVHTITQKTKTEDIIPISDEALKLIEYSPEKKGLVFKGLKRGKRFLELVSCMVFQPDSTIPQHSEDKDGRHHSH